MLLDYSPCESLVQWPSEKTIVIKALKCVISNVGNFITGQLKQNLHGLKTFK